MVIGEEPRPKLTARIRWASWSVLLVCFFLPFCRGCSGQPELPYKDAFDSWGDALFRGLPFLYPLLLLVGQRVLQTIRSERLRLRIAEMCYAVTFVLLTFIVYYVVDQAMSMEIATASVREVIGGLACHVTPLALWGGMGFGVRRLSVDSIGNRLAFYMSAVALWLIAFPCQAMCSNLLVGGWLSLGASTLVVLTYAFDALANWWRSPLGAASRTK